MADVISDLSRQADEELLQRWTATRARGRIRYILLRGVLQWGGLMALGMSIGWWLAWGWRPRLLLLIAFLLVCFTVGGYVVGSCFWKQNERRYVELTREARVSEDAGDFGQAGDSGQAGDPGHP
jgi:hypothetical protein